MWEPLREDYEREVAAVLAAAPLAKMFDAAYINSDRTTEQSGG